MDQRFCDQCGTALPASGAARAVAPGELGAPELRVVSVLFIDLVGFTALSESRDAEDVRELLGRYFDSARTIVGRYGGLVEKFIGDAVMAVWGTPLAREDDAERAVRAALEIVDAVAVLGGQVGAPGLCARAGVVTGQAASVATPGQGLVVGDRVNTASRVQSSAQPGAVLVDGVTRQVTGAAVAYEDAGEYVVKGKSKPLRLWRAARVVAGVGGAQREPGLQAPFVGRDADLRSLKALFHGGLEHGAGRLVAVSGSAGIGKSRLRGELENYVDGLAASVLWHSGRCLSYGDGIAYWALAGMVRQRLGIAENAASEEGAAKLASGLERWVPDVDDRVFLTPRLGALLGLAEPGLDREELFAGWRLFFERLAGHEPVILVFEDLQWADDGLLDFIEHLLDWSARSPIFMLALFRPELSEHRGGWPPARRGVTRLDLEALQDSAIGGLLDTLINGLPSSAREGIVAQAQGNPLYAIETIRVLADQGVLAERGGCLVFDGELGELEVPASLSSLLGARLDALAASERELIKTMAVFGGAFPRSAAAALLDLADDQLDAALSSLVRKQVLTIRTDPRSPDRGQYTFAQELLRTVAYERLTRKDRKPRHRAAAEHLRRAFPNDGEEVSEAIASHYLDAYRAAAGDFDAEPLRREAVAALRRAAQRAATVGAPETAERAYRTALELVDSEPDRTELTRAAGEMAHQAGRSEVALQHFEVVAAAYLAAGREIDAARLVDRSNGALFRLGRFEEVTERTTVALGVLGTDESDPDVGALRLWLGAALVFGGRHREAGPSLDAAIRTAQTVGPPSVLSRALSDKAAMCFFGGRAEEARALLDASISVAEQHQLTDVLALAHVNNGSIQLCMDMPGAAGEFQASLALARHRGDRVAESTAAGNLMYLHLLAGRWEELERLAEELFTDTGEDRPGAEYLHYPLALLHILRGELDAARTSLEQLSGWEQSGSAEALAMRGSVIVGLDLAGGRAARALEAGKHVVSEAIRKLGAANETVRNSWPDTVQAALHLGDLDSAHELLAVLADQPPGHVPPYLLAQVSRYHGLISAMGSGPHTCEADLTAAIDTFDALGYPYWHACAQSELAAWLMYQHRQEKAEHLLSEASITLRSLGALPALAKAKHLMSVARDGVAPHATALSRMENGSLGITPRRQPPKQRSE